MKRTPRKQPVIKSVSMDKVLLEQVEKKLATNPESTFSTYIRSLIRKDVAKAA